MIAHDFFGFELIKLLILAHELLECPKQDEKICESPNKKRLHSPEAPEKRRRTSSSSSSTDEHQRNEMPKAGKNPPKFRELCLRKRNEVQNMDIPSSSKVSMQTVESQNSNKLMRAIKPETSTNELESPTHVNNEHKSKHKKAENGSLLYKYYSNR